VRGTWPLLLVAACNDVDRDLLVAEPSPCTFTGAIGEWVDITPPELLFGGTDPTVRDLAMDPYDPSILYAGSHAQGLWKTSDCGASWVHVNTGINRVAIDNAVLISVAPDATTPDTVYASPWFSANNIWWSTNGGVHWEEILPESESRAITGSVADVWQIAVDPFAPHHLIASTSTAWLGANGDAGILEGRYLAGVWQWTAHPPAPGMGTQQRIGFVDASTWLVTSPSDPSGEGGWRSTNGGETFERIGTSESAQTWQWYRSRDGTLYQTGRNGLYRSADNGATWIDVFAGLDLPGTQAIIGDGERLYASLTLPNPDVRVRMVTAPEVPGDREWGPIGDASSFSFDKLLRDPQRNMMYAFNGYHGVFRMQMK